MSMISAQCDELRFMAHMLDTDGHPSFAREVRRAADTIWELRNKLAGTVDQSERIIELEDENAKLDRRRRSLQADVERLGGIIHRQRKELSTMQYAIECRNDENAKLRELLADTLIDPRDYCAKYGIDYDGWDSANDDIDRRLRELGIEVD